MEGQQNIHYLEREALDIDKWNKCISRAGNGRIYSYSWYLDHMSKHWDALVLDDYTAVMPLTWNKKYGVHYLYQPFLAPHLGITGRNITGELLDKFLQVIPKKFRFVEINLNAGNNFDIRGLPLKKHANYFLDLSRTYRTISSHYNENLRRNIRKAAAAGCEFDNKMAAAEIIHLAAKKMAAYTRLQQNDIPRFIKLSEELIAKKQALACGVHYNHKLAASCLFFTDKKRWYYILASTEPEGKKTGASHFLLDCFIREHAGQEAVLDFAGSDFPSIANFYRSFGATPEYYRSLRINRLPKLVRWLKD